MKRRGPQEGYGQGEDGSKRHYRRAVWAVFRDAIRPHCAASHVLCMPSAEGVEAEVAMAAGFREPRLHLVDDNPAIVAHYLAPRFPRAMRYGVTAWRAVDTIGRRGTQLTAANFDFTANLNNRLATDLYLLGALQHAFTPESYVAVTIQKGRETGDWWDGIQSWHPGEQPRLINTQTGEAITCRSRFPGLDDRAISRIADLQWLLGLAGHAWHIPLRAGQYTSARVPMLWVVWKRLRYDLVDPATIDFLRSLGSRTIPSAADRRLADAAVGAARDDSFRLILKGDHLHMQLKGTLTQAGQRPRQVWTDLMDMRAAIRAQHGP